ncbi:MAG: hypothetical protein L3J39_11600 [Verrucomicrobiales bacterium]|nr:hypothetical protein [Verrucomicrobiales bacterium]
MKDQKTINQQLVKVLSFSGLALLLFNAPLFAQESSGYVSPAPSSSYSVAPTSTSGRAMQAYQPGKKKRKRWVKRPKTKRVQTYRETADDVPVRSSGDLSVLPPMPSAFQKQPVGWLAKRKAKRNQKVHQVQQPQLEHVFQGQSSVGVSHEATQVAKTMPEPVYYEYTGPAIDPTTPSGKPLRAFNRSSRHIQNQQVVAKGTLPPSGGVRWLSRAKDIQSEEPSGSKWSWENPFNNPVRRKAGMHAVPVAGAQAGGEVSGPDGSGIAAPGVTDETQLLANLRGVVIVPRTLDVKKSGRSGVSGVLTEGVELPQKVQDSLAEYLGKALSLAVLDEMVRKAVVAYRSSDMPVVDVLVPEQEINDGVLQLVVIEGRVGKVIVEGAKYTDPQFLKDQISLKKGQVLKESSLLADLQWMNKNPFRQVDMIYSPGFDYGTTDLILRTHDVKPLSFYVGVENSGNSLLGDNRFISGFNWAGPLFFGQENTLNYQYSSDLDFDKMTSHSVVWTSYLPWRHHLTLLGAWVNQDIDTMAAGEVVNIGGKNQQGSVRYTIPLKGSGRWVHEAEVGFDYKSSNSNLAFGGLEVFDTTTQILQLGLGYNIIQSDRWGSTKIDNEVIWSPGGITGENTTQSFRAQRGGAEANYVYGRSSIERNFFLPKGWGLITRVVGQLSSASLLASETLGAGGFDTVRGWEQRIVLGDQGAVANVELRTPSMSPANLIGFHNTQDGMQFLTFFDYGYVSSLNRAAGIPSSFGMGSVGVGLRYQLDDNFSLRLDYGYQMIERNFDDGENGRIHFGGRANF